MKKFIIFILFLFVFKLVTSQTNILPTSGPVGFVNGTNSQNNISWFSGNGLRINSNGGINSQDGIMYQSGLNGGGAGIGFGRNGGYDTWMSFYTNMYNNAGQGNIIERMRLNDYGNLGIGVTDPYAKLHVNGTSYFASTALFGSWGIGSTNDYGMYYVDRGTQWTEFAIHNQGSGAMLYANPHPTYSYSGMWETMYPAKSAGLISNPYTPLVFGAGGEAMRILPNGNVGLGTQNPSSKLDVAKDGSDLLTLTSTIGNINNKVNFFMDTYSSPYHESRIQVIDNGDWSGNITFSTKTPGALANGLEERLRITSSGNIGIGTTNPGIYKLAVRGAAIFTKVQVKADNGTSWPDYVFHKSYNLRSLAALETYIQEYNHLPDVPSEKEVEANGVNLGSTQAVLLKKIEELTLYVIEQDKKINILQREMKQKKNN